MTKVMQQFNRVGIFHSVEVQEEVLDGEWVRVTERSTKPLDELINQFLERRNATVISVSAPNIVLVATSSDKKQRTYRCSASVIYRTLDVIQNEVSNNQEQFDLSGVPEIHRQHILETVRNGKPDVTTGIAGLGNVLQRANSQARKGLQPTELNSIPSGDKRPSNRTAPSRAARKPRPTGRKGKKSGGK